MRIVVTPIRAPNANAFCERWIGTLRAECLDWTLVLGRRHLERVLGTYIEHYNEARPHRGLALRTPIGNPSPAVGNLRPPTFVGGMSWAASFTSTEPRPEFLDPTRFATGSPTRLAPVRFC
jgi:Integrase core domain